MPTFNEAERYLLHQWSDARLLEESMGALRVKYAGILSKALEGFQKNHKELDAPVDKYAKTYGSIGIGRQSWLFKQWPSGFWIDDVRLENLTSQEEVGPSKSVVIYDERVELQKAEEALRSSAKQMLSKVEFDRLEFETTQAKAYFWCNLEQSREELLKLLMEKDGQGFVDCMIGHLEWMARWVPILDEILSQVKGSRK
jgi:hypothetical protein